MKDISSKKAQKDVITGFRLNKENVYYTCLFGIAFVISIVLMLVGKAQENKGLITYASFLIPLFFMATAVAARFVYVSKNTIYTAEGKLVLKTFLRTVKIEIASIKTLKTVQQTDKSATYVQIGRDGKVEGYGFKRLTKEEVTHLRRATSKF